MTDEVIKEIHRALGGSEHCERDACSLKNGHAFGDHAPSRTGKRKRHVVRNDEQDLGSDLDASVPDSLCITQKLGRDLDLFVNILGSSKMSACRLGRRAGLTWAHTPSHWQSWQ